ncbi:MAG: hypothetical protein HDR46_00920 [Bacteroides sp.]|nr:hypothetical protein [Bacteroides sp.]
MSRISSGLTAENGDHFHSAVADAFSLLTFMSPTVIDTIRVSTLAVVASWLSVVHELTAATATSARLS